MLSEPHSGMAKFSAAELIDLSRWKKIQDLFAEIIGANLWLIDPFANPLTLPSKISGYCSDFKESQDIFELSHEGCIAKAFHAWENNRESSFCCPHLLHFFTLPIKTNQDVIAFVVAGPILLGKREEEKIYKAMCEREKLDSEIFLDRVREVKIFSYNSTRVMMDFLKELSEYVVKLSYERQELERLLPGFLASQKERREFLATNLFSSYLLDVASEFVRADSGSVLLMDRSGKSFSIKSAKGIKSEMLNKRLPASSGVAGWVIAQKKPVLIDKDSAEGIPKSKLKRPQIKSSIVVPLEYQKKVLGVFCLNSKSANKRFNKNSLQLLDNLGKLASVALARSSAN